MGDDLRAAKPDAVVIIAAEHFANFHEQHAVVCNRYGRSYEARSKTRIGLALNDVGARQSRYSQRSSGDEGFRLPMPVEV